MTIVYAEDMTVKHLPTDPSITEAGLYQLMDIDIYMATKNR